MLKVCGRSCQGSSPIKCFFFFCSHSYPYEKTSEFSLNHTECPHCDCVVSHTAFIRVWSLSSGVVCWSGRRRYMVTCTNRLVLTDTVIITRILSPACAILSAGQLCWDMKHSHTHTRAHTPLCLVTNNRLQWGLRCSDCFSISHNSTQHRVSVFTPQHAPS